MTEEIFEELVKNLAKRCKISALRFRKLSKFQAG